MPLAITIIIILIIVIFIIATFNGLNRKKIYVREAWSSIDVQLQRKGNILPNLVDTLKMQTNYEGNLLQKITEARTGIMEGSNDDRMKANDEMSKILPSLYAVAENYPTLASSASFQQLMSEISDCENKITYARNRYNISVTSFNTAIITFPGVIFAGMMGLKAQTFYEIPNEQRESIDSMRIKDIQ